MKKIFLSVFILFISSGIIYARDFVIRYPQGTPMDVDNKIYSAGGWKDLGTGIILNTSSDNVGIGSTSPRAKLDVNGSAYINGDLTSTGSLITNGTSGTGFITDKAVYIGGNVGIGTTSSAQKLHVDGAVYFGSGNVGINTVSPLAQLSIKNNNTTPLMVSKTSSGDLLIVTSAGNVGIGTASPQQLLDMEVDGNVYAMYRAVTGTGQSVGWRAVRGAWSTDALPDLEMVNVGGATRLRTYYNSTYSALLYFTSPTSGGNIGIHNEGPSAYLDLKQSADTNVGGFKATNTSGNGSTRVWTDSSNIARIDGGGSANNAISLNGAGNGNVGIGTITPRAKFDVDGACYFGENAVNGSGKAVAVCRCSNGQFGHVTGGTVTSPTCTCP